MPRPRPSLDRLVRSFVWPYGGSRVILVSIDEGSIVAGARRTFVRTARVREAARSKNPAKRQARECVRLPAPDLLFARVSSRHATRRSRPSYGPSTLKLKGAFAHPSGDRSRARYPSDRGEPVLVRSKKEGRHCRPSFDGAARCRGPSPCTGRRTGRSPDRLPARSCLRSDPRPGPLPRSRCRPGR